ncbi:MAG: helicase-exonuclease AddAB subunit AddB [Bacillota bacterium]
MVCLSLRFILGPAGSGKTKYIVDRLVEEILATGAATGARPATILLVPDQSTFQMERLILADPRVDGFMHLHVLSFRRLCMRVLEETGGLSLPFITGVGRSMAIQAILWERRDELSVFAPMVNYPGFRETLGRTLSELSAYDVAPSTIGGLGPGEAMPFLDQKIHDLSLVFDQYREFLKGRFLDPDDYLELASQRMSASPLLRGATVWIDGFSGFTPKEYKAISAILRTGSQVNMALCVDREEIRRKPNPASLFHPTRETYDKVNAVAWDAGVTVESALYLEGIDGGPELPRFMDAPGLAALERAVRSDGLEPQAEASPGLAVDGGSVRLISATNPLAELEFVAREILRLVRDRGMRFRDVTVEARDLTEYAGMLPLVFGDHRIPFFLDRKRSLSHHPLSELIRAALDVVLTGWSFDAVMRYLKTDLVGVERSEIDVLENYVLSHGIVGEKWIASEPWGYARKYMAREDQAAEREEGSRVADGIRRKAAQALGKFYLRLKTAKSGAVTATGISQAVCDLLLDLDVPGQLAKWQSLAEQAKDLSGAVDHGGLWDKAMEILGQVGEILKDQPHDLKAYALLLSAGLEDIRMGAIPPSLDQVIVGSLDRSRQPDCKATFLIGALLGVFPKRQTEDSIFTDAEREFLSENGVDLEPASIQRQFHEKYLVYIALTRPSNVLYVSYPLGDQEGKALTPSHVVNLVKHALPGVAEELVSVDPPGTMPHDLDYVLPARTSGIALRRLSLLRKGTQPGDAWTEAFRWMLGPEQLPRYRGLLGSLSHTNKVAALAPGLVRGLYGQTLHTSVSRLETFAACPFQHFARDGLSLHEREVYRLEPADAGVFLHAALRAYVDEVGRSGLDWASLTDDWALGVIDRVVERLTPELSGELFVSSARYKYIAAALRRILRRAGGMLLSHLKRGQFRPVAAEVLFGFAGGPKPYRIDLPGKDEVLLRGQIDRIDAAVSEGGLYVRVVDYKSSPRSLDFVDVYNGLALQLLVYLLVVMQSWKEIAKAAPPALLRLLGGAEPQPAGALYFSVIDPIVSASGPLLVEDAEKQMAKRFRMSGLVMRDPAVARLMDADSQSSSDIIPVQFLSGGGLAARSSAATRDDFLALLDFVRDKVRDMSSEIFKGCADIAPFRKGAARACQYCPYGPLCCFDVLVEGNSYRVVRPAPQDALWEEVRKHRTGGTDRG